MPIIHDLDSLSIEDCINQIFLGDSYCDLSLFPSNFINYILTDHPYNIASIEKITKVGSKIVSNKKAWGEKFEDSVDEKLFSERMEYLAGEYNRMLVKGGNLIIFHDKNRPDLLKPFFNRFIVKNTYIFIKLNPIPHIRKNNNRNCYEKAIFFQKPKYIQNQNDISDVSEAYWFSKGERPNTFNFSNQNEMRNVLWGHIGQGKLKYYKKKENKWITHPTQKYEWMVSPLIERHSNEGDLIADFFMGSGIHLLLAKKYRRKYLGMDNNPEFYEMANNFINNTARSKKITIPKFNSTIQKTLF